MYSSYRHSTHTGTVVKAGVGRVFYFIITVSSSYLKERIAESKNLQVWVFGKTIRIQDPPVLRTRKKVKLKEPWIPAISKNHRVPWKNRRFYARLFDLFAKNLRITIMYKNRIFDFCLTVIIDSDTQVGTWWVFDAVVDTRSALVKKPPAPPPFKIHLNYFYNRVICKVRKKTASVPWIWS